MTTTRDRLALFASLVAGATLALGCSSKPESAAPPDAGHYDHGDAGALLSDAGEGQPLTDSGPAACTADPTCDYSICDCANGTHQATGVCKGAAGCDYSGACTRACGGPSSGSDGFPPCTSAIDCETSQPSINCTCTQGAWTAFNACTSAGYCTDYPEEVCPAVCAQQQSGTWAGCAQDSDCAPIECACGDGTRPVSTPAVGLPQGSCQADGQCAGPGGFCPSACSAHGGWTAPAGPVDAGVDAATGQGNPGDACTDASQCKLQSCTCTDGMAFSGLRVCDTSTDTCAALSETCSLSCFNDGGWSGP